MLKIASKFSQVKVGDDRQDNNRESCEEAETEKIKQQDDRYDELERELSTYRELFGQENQLLCVDRDKIDDVTFLVLPVGRWRYFLDLVIDEADERI